MKISINNFVFILFLGSFFLTFNQAIIKLSVFSLMDELFLFLSLIIIIFHNLQEFQLKKIKKIYLLFIIYIFYQVLNTYISPFNSKISLSLLQSLINIKVFLVSFSLLLLWNNSSTQRKILINIYFIMLFLFLIGFFANFLLQEKWNYLLGDDIIKYRYGFISPVGWFGSKGQVIYYFSITLVTLFLLYSKSQIIKISVFVRKFFFFTIIDFLMAFPLAGRKGFMMVVPFGLIATSLLKGKKKIVFIVFASLFFMLFLFLISDMQIFQSTKSNILAMTTDEDNSYIRGLIVFYGASLFYEFFPIWYWCSNIWYSS